MSGITSPINFHDFYNDPDLYSQEELKHFAFLVSVARQKLRSEKVSSKTRIYKTFFDPSVTLHLRPALHAPCTDFKDDLIALLEAVYLSTKYHYKKIVDPFTYLPRFRHE